MKGLIYALVFEPKKPNVCAHGHLAQTVGVKIELVVNPVSEVLHNITGSQLLVALSSTYPGQSYLVNSLEFLQRLAVLFASQETANKVDAAQSRMTQGEHF